MTAKQSQTKSSGAPEDLNGGLNGVADVREYLQARINPTVVHSLEASIRLAWPAPAPAQTQDANHQLDLIFALIFELKGGQLTWLNDRAQAQATFWFRDAQDVGHLLSSSDTAYIDFMDRFMAAELRSDGYLPWAFTLLSLFRGGPSLTTPS